MRLLALEELGSIVIDRLKSGKRSAIQFCIHKVTPPSRCLCLVNVETRSGTRSQGLGSCLGPHVRREFILFGGGPNYWQRDGFNFHALRPLRRTISILIGNLICDTLQPPRQPLQIRTVLVQRSGQDWAMQSRLQDAVALHDPL
jgi:hypothetical protein